MKSVPLICAPHLTQWPVSSLLAKAFFFTYESKIPNSVEKVPVDTVAWLPCLKALLNCNLKKEKKNILFCIICKEWQEHPCCMWKSFCSNFHSSTLRFNTGQQTNLQLHTMQFPHDFIRQHCEVTIKAETPNYRLKYRNKPKGINPEVDLSAWFSFKYSGGKHEW